MILAIDFDGTLTEDRFPEIGPARVDVIEWVLRQKKYGHKLILWTCREGSSLREALDWCLSRGIIYDAVNENVEEMKYLYMGKSKVIADLYLDDKSGNVEGVIQLENAMEFGNEIVIPFDGM